MAKLARVGLVIVTVSAAACSSRTEDIGTSEQSISRRSGYEVWIVDQSNTTGTTWGGRISIFDGKDLEGCDPATRPPSDVIDLSAAATTMCFAKTGANPVRPHMIFTNGAQTHMVLSFVASGHVVIFDAASREPVDCIRTTVGDGGARQVHAAIPAPDDTYILAANQNGKLLERIDADYTTNTFTLNTAAMIDLANCVTPNGFPCQLPTVRGDNAPLCPIIDLTSRYGFVTLRGGGLFVVDAKQTPMKIVGEYDQTTVHPNGCLGAEHDGTMYLSSGGGTANNLSEMDLYGFPSNKGYSAANPINTPAPLVVFSDDDPAKERDGHGATLTKHGKYLWFYDRKNGNAEVFETKKNRHVGTVSFNGAVTTDAAPDLGKLSPNGKYMYISFRGPVPLSGDPHVSTGEIPGIGVVELMRGGKSGRLTAIVPITNVDGAGVERADTHAIELRRTF